MRLLGCFIFSPTPPGLGFPFLFLSPPLPLWSSAPFFYGGGAAGRPAGGRRRTGGARQGKAGRLLLSQYCFQIGCMCVCCSGGERRGRELGRALRLFSDQQVHILQSHHPASLINLQCSPIVSEYFVFVQSGEFPASCICQGVCVCSCPGFPSSCVLLHAALAACLFHSTHRPLHALCHHHHHPRRPFFFHARCNAMPVNHCGIIKQKCLHKRVLWASTVVVGEKNVFTFLYLLNVVVVVVNKCNS